MYEKMVEDYLYKKCCMIIAMVKNNESAGKAI